MPSSITRFSATSPSSIATRPTCRNRPLICGPNAVRNLQIVAWSGTRPSSSQMKSSRLAAASSSRRLERIPSDSP